MPFYFSSDSLIYFKRNYCFYSALKPHQSSLNAYKDCPHFTYEESEAERLSDSDKVTPRVIAKVRIKIQNFLISSLPLSLLYKLSLLSFFFPLKLALKAQAIQSF